MTTVDVTYRLVETPREASMIALVSLRKVYGVRRVQVDEQRGSITVEFDATRLSAQAVRQLLRRAGLVLDEAAGSDSVPDQDTVGAHQ